MMAKLMENVQKKGWKSPDMKTRLDKLLAILNQGLVEREEAIKVALLAALAGEHVLLLGPPGTAKSLLARRIARLFGNDYFEYLLTKFTTPDELFGPLSLSALKADRFERKVQGYLPTARIAFLDEIFKANSSILNALLSLLNERVFHNGEKRLSAPLQALIAASSELPEDDEALAALYDRFLLRLHITGVSDAALPRLFEDSAEPTITPLPLDEVNALRERARRATLPQEVGDALRAIWLSHRETFREDARERLSDRRLKKAIWLLKVCAASNDRDAVDLSDLMVLRHCLWNHPANAPRVRELVLAAVLEAAGRLVPAQDDLVGLERPENGRATEIIRSQSGYRKADILMISDGDCAISPEFAAWLAQQKESLGCLVYSRLANGVRAEDSFGDEVVVL